MMTKENKMPEYVFMNDASINYFLHETTGYTRYAKCPEGSFVVSRAQLESLRWDDKDIKNSGFNFNDKVIRNMTINEILKIGESDE